MAKKKDELVMRHIFEARLVKKRMSFLNLQGIMMDELLSKFDLTRFALQNDGSKIELTNDATTETYFFSTDNFGLQLDAVDNFDLFKSKLKNFLSVLKGTQYYDLEKGIKRIGTKSQVMYSTHNESPEKALEIFNKKYKVVNDDIEKNINSKITDVGYVYDLNLPSGNCKVTLAPGNKSEIIEKVFANKSKEYAKKIKGNGIRFFDIDIAQNGEPATTEWDFLQTQSDKQIEDLEKLLNGLNNFLNSENN